jgi:hypothetical protein
MQLKTEIAKLTKMAKIEDLSGTYWTQKLLIIIWLNIKSKCDIIIR